jgi:hypothetical protein
MQYSVQDLDHLSDLPALQRFAAESRVEFPLEYVDMRVFDFTLGSKYDLASEYTTCFRSGNLRGLGFIQRPEPRPNVTKRTFPHLVYVGPDGAEPTEVLCHVFPVEIYKNEQSHRTLQMSVRKTTLAVPVAEPTVVAKTPRPRRRQESSVGFAETPASSAAQGPLHPVRAHGH